MAGRYSTPTASIADDFLIGFYDSGSGVPLDSAFAEYTVGSVTRTDLGLGSLGYEASISALNLDSEIQYFISIANNSSSLDGSWFWSSNGLGNGDGFYRVAAGSSWVDRPADYDFQLIGTVPIPSAIWLFGSGILALTAIARRKKAT